MDDNKFEFLEKEQSPAIRFLLAKTDRLEKTITKLQQTCEMLYKQVYSDGIDRKENE